MKRKLSEVADYIEARLLGEEAVISGIASIASAAAGDIIFVEDEKGLPEALRSKATAVIAGDFAVRHGQSKPLLIAEQPKLAFARAAQLFRSLGKTSSGVHRSATVDPSAKVAKNARIGEHVVIGKAAEIGDGARIGAGCVIGDGVRVGRNCQIYPNVTIYSGTQIGERVIIHAGAVLGSDGFGYVRDAKTGRYEKFPQVGRLEIDDDVEIGANTTVDRGALDATRIGRGTKIDNLVHIGHNVQIGEDVVIAAQTGFSGSAAAQDGVIIGGQVGIGEHARIEAGAILGGQSGILPKKVLRGRGLVFWGTPARPIKEYLKELAVLARLAKKEPT